MSTTTEGDLSYREKFNEQISTIGIVVLEPKMMSQIVKYLQKTDKVFCRKGISNILDISNQNIGDIIISSSQKNNKEKSEEFKKIHKNSRVIALEPFDVNNNNNNNNSQTTKTNEDSSSASASATSSSSSSSNNKNIIITSLQQLPQEILDALRSSILASSSTTATNNNNNKSSSDGGKKNKKSSASNSNSKSTLQQFERQQLDSITNEALEKTFSLTTVNFQLSYKNYIAVEILQRLLPSNVVVPAGYEQVGHIAHLNLLPCHEPYKKIIAQVFLDCNSANTIKTIVNKTEAIQSEFRELPFELLAGEADYNAVVKQHGIEFHVPYDKVYWNSKLSQEHTRLVTEAMQSGDELLDVMAGVGPFAVPASVQTGVRVFANDLNPAASEAMKVNAKINKVFSEENFQVFNLDGREFVRKMRDERLKLGEIGSSAAAAVVGSSKNTKNTKNNNNNNLSSFQKNIFRKERCLRHFVMNLPATAVLFLDAFVGDDWPQPVSSISSNNNSNNNNSSSSSSSSSSFDYTFVVHVYCFSAKNDPQEASQDAIDQVSRVLKMPVGEQQQQNNNNNNNNQNSVLVHRVHVVRDVAPNKLMVCVSFSPMIVAPTSSHEKLREEIHCFKTNVNEKFAQRRDRE